MRLTNFSQKLTTELTLYTLITTAVPLNFAQNSWLNGSLDLPCDTFELQL